MAMNKQRRTSNINNVVTYDSAGNVVLPNTITLGLPVSSMLKTDSTGKIVAATLGTDYAPYNIYTSDGVLSSDRIVNSGGFSITFNPNLYLYGNLTGNLSRVRSNLSGTSYNQNATVFINQADTPATGDLSRILLMGQQQITSSLSTYGQTSAFDFEQHITGTIPSARVALYNLIYQFRGYASDVSTNGNNLIYGLNIYNGHNRWDTDTQIYTSQVWGAYSLSQNYVGVINQVINFRATFTSFSAIAKANTTNNYYSFYSGGHQVGVNSGVLLSSIINYYGLYLEAPTVRATGSITNRWGVYASDPLMNNAFVGNVLIGTTTVQSPAYKLDVVGFDARFNGVVVGLGNNNIATNTVVGNGAGSSIISATRSVLIGYEAGKNVTTGTSYTGSVVIGYQAGLNMTTGFWNVMIGDQAGRDLTTGTRNTFVGEASGYKITTASGNTLIGDGTGTNITTGGYNTVVGVNAAQTITTGTYNIVLGVSSTVVSTGNYNVFIGNTLSGISSTLSNNIIIADGQGNIRFRDDNTSTILSRLAGTGTRMVVSGTNGELSTQEIAGIPSSRTLTINSISYDLSANRSWSVGTVTSVSALTISSTGTDVTSSVATGTTTPVITLNIPSSSATNRGVLSAADWITFNNKADYNIYTSNGTLTGNRVVSMATNYIVFNDGYVGIGAAPASINSFEVNAPNKWSGAFVGNLGAARTPSVPYGIHLGWNYTGGSAEANIIWGTQGAGGGGNPYLTISSWDGTNKVDRWILSDIGKLTLPAYIASTSFSGTPVGCLAFDLSGNIITIPVPSGGGGSISDGDKGDITVSGSGTTWLIDNSTIGISKLTASGTPSATTYLRGDNTWATISTSGITLSGIGSTPNANAATLTGSVLNLQPASGLYGGVITTGTQSFSGDKSFLGTLGINGGFDNVKSGTYVPTFTNIGGCTSFTLRYASYTRIDNIVIVSISLFVTTSTANNNNMFEATLPFSTTFGPAIAGTGSGVYLSGGFVTDSISVSIADVQLGYSRISFNSGPSTASSPIAFTIQYRLS